MFQDDYRVSIANGIIKKGGKLPCPVDANGKFTAEVTDFTGQYVKVQRMEKKIKALRHKYGFLWHWAFHDFCLGCR